MPKMLFDRAKLRQVRLRYHFGYFWYLSNLVQKIEVALPSCHSRFLQRLTSRFTLHPASGQLEQNRLAKVKTFAHRQVLLHPIRIDHEAIYELSQPIQHIVEQCAGVRKNDPFHAAMTDVSLMPQRDIFERRNRVTANDASQTTQTFSCNRIALMRHSRTPFLAGTEVLFEFAHFGSLQMAELGRPAIDTGGNEG